MGKLPPYKNVPVADLVPYASNARTHSEAQVAQIAGSIREFGFVNPVLIDAGNGVIAGHGRILAAKSLGLEQVPCVEVGWLSDAQKRAYILADNNLALTAEWDQQTLECELAKLEREGFDLSIAGFGETTWEPLSEMPDLLSGERLGVRTMTFVLSEGQVVTVKSAIESAMAIGPFGETGDRSDNGNGNGNALARVAEFFLKAHPC